MRFIKITAYGAWLGFALHVAGVHYYQWEFYLVIVPTVLLSQWGRKVTA